MTCCSKSSADISWGFMVNKAPRKGDEMGFEDFLLFVMAVLLGGCGVLIYSYHKSAQARKKALSAIIGAILGLFRRR